MRCYRIGSGLHPVFDGTGAAMVPGRWNEAGQTVIYCGTSFAIAALERLCYAVIGRLPATDRYVEIDVPDGSAEIFDMTVHPGWAVADSQAARRYGSEWWTSRRSLCLIVPSAVTGLDMNLVINPSHPRFRDVIPSSERPVVWDKRLFRS